MLQVTSLLSEETVQLGSRSAALVERSNGVVSFGDAIDTPRRSGLW